MLRKITWRWKAVGALTVALLVGLAGVSSSHASADRLALPVALHATLRPIDAAPPADAVEFVGSLRGRTLSWQLNFHRLSSDALLAHLHVGTATAGTRLCDPCSSGRKGTAKLTQAVATALRRGGASVDLHSAKRQQAALRGQLELGTAPTLVIFSPRDGDTITLPAPVRFSVTGITLGDRAGHIVAVMENVAEPVRVELQVSGEAGLAYLPANKFLTGKRDLTFTLVLADGTVPDGSRAQVTIRALTIEGGRSAPASTETSTAPKAAVAPLAAKATGAPDAQVPSSGAIAAPTAPSVSNPTPPASEGTAPKQGVIARLSIKSPRDGELVTLPSAVRFTVTGFVLGDGAGHVQATFLNGPESVSVQLQPGSEAGLAYIPANKMLTGKRDLTFTLVGPDGVTLENLEARVTVRSLTIEGGR